MFRSPLAVALSGATALAIVALHAATDYRRNTVSHQTYAHLELLEPTVLLMTSDRLWELDVAASTDEISPDHLARVIPALITDLLNLSTARGVALDWGSFRTHIFDNEGVSKVIARVDVLS